MNLEQQLREVFEELGISKKIRVRVEAMLAPIKEKSPVTREHYEHSIRVAISALKIARFINVDGRPVFYAGLFHDIGKCAIPLEVLGKTGKWTKKDQREIKRHVMVGYRMLRGQFDFSAEIMLLHHKFQPNGYPVKLPKKLRKYSEETLAQIREYGRILALADQYDALRRKNSKFGKGVTLADEEIKEKMLEFNPDMRHLIANLYQVGIFVCR